MSAAISTGGARFKALGLHAALIVAAVAVVGPFLWIAIASLRTQISLMMGEVLFTPVLLNFEELLL